MAKDWNGVQNGNPSPDVRESITRLGLEFRLMTQFTSFVAVEETIVTEGGRPRRIEVPVEMPEGVNYEGVFGERDEALSRAAVGKMSIAAGAFPQRSMVKDAAMPAQLEEPIRQSESSARKLDPRLAQLAVGHPQTGVKVLSGKVAVEIWLAEPTLGLLARLKSLGFKVIVEPKIAKVLIGWLPINKLEEAASMKEVRHIAPYLYQ